MFKNKQFVFSFDKMFTGILAASLCFSMSYWQWTRYLEKKIYFSQLDAQTGKAPKTLTTIPAEWSDWLLSTLHFEGEFDFEKEVVLINRSMNEQTGVRVVTPFHLKGSDIRILVDRGFLPYKDYAEKNYSTYRFPGETYVEGILRPSQKKSFFLAPSTKTPAPNEWRERWLRLEVEKMASQLPYPILPVFLEQTNQQGPWPLFDPKEITSPGRHLNYTFQWLGFGLFALFLVTFLQFRPKQPQN